jgi:hypothetical protein
MTAFLLEHIGERKIAGTHHRDDIEHRGTEVARRVCRNRDAIGKRMKQLAAAEARAGARGKEHGDEWWLRSHASNYSDARSAPSR